jgi:hypothetical protein
MPADAFLTTEQKSSLQEESGSLRRVATSENLNQDLKNNHQVIT